MGTPYQILFITTFSGEGGFTTNKQSNSLSKISLLQELGMLNSSNDEFCVLQWVTVRPHYGNKESARLWLSVTPTRGSPSPGGPVCWTTPSRVVVGGRGIGSSTVTATWHQCLRSSECITWDFGRLGYFWKVLFSPHHIQYMILPVFSFAPPKIYLFRNSLVFITVDSLTRKYGMRKNGVKKKNIIVVT